MESEGVYENNIDEDPEFVDVSALRFSYFGIIALPQLRRSAILDPDGTVSDMGYCFTMWA